MSDLAVSAEKLSKAYQITSRRLPNDTLRDALGRRARTLLRRQARAHVKTREFWALKDVSFEIRCGNVLGIIGRNGAGKSTLLKILSRITEPTSGRACMYGRVASLLEVGTGFNGELTGRENIYLNGAILGMKKAEVTRKFDQIVDFAGVDQFLETPVKRYSSGMYVRLAFGVAAHLEPDILIVDEVLAVGDASFQKKCLTRMQDVGKEGRTVIFVSHNMQTITRLCKTVLLLDEGSVAQVGPTHDVVGAYLLSGLGMTAEREYPAAKAPGNELVRVHAVRVRTEDGEITDVVDIARQIGIEMEFEVLQAGCVLTPCFGFTNEEGIQLFVASDRDPNWQRRPREAGRYRSTGWIPGNLFSEGTIIVGAGIITESPFRIHCDDENAVAFQVVETIDHRSSRGDFAGPIPGVIRPRLKWNTEFVPSVRVATFAER